MRNTVKSEANSPQVFIDHDVVYVNSDRYFNGSNRVGILEDMGIEVQPVDVFGGFVPQNKSLSNLKKTEQAIRERFDLGK